MINKILSYLSTVPIMKFVISLVVILIAATRVWKPDLAIDQVTVALIIVALLPWAGSVFKAIELPGGLKVEYPEVKKIEKKAEHSGFIQTEGAHDSLPQKQYSFEKIADEDANLALAGLRIEIESKLQKIASSYSIQQNRSIRKLINDLQEHEALNSSEVSVLMDLLPLLNRAVHGAKVDQEACYLAINMGKDILSALDKREGAPDIGQLIEQWKKRDGAAFTEVGTELSKSFVKSPAAFLSVMKSNPDVLASWLDNIDTNTFTMFEARDSLDDDLYTSYYEKLKELMEQTASNYLKGKFRKESKMILERVKKIKIRKIL